LSTNDCIISLIAEVSNSSLPVVKFHRSARFLSLEGIFNVAQGGALGNLIGSMMFPEGELQNAGKAFEVPLQGTDMGGRHYPPRCGGLR
ncbi:MAG: hypothetical protein PHV82_08225, partial [Victivallaceae bacterium]|nr:hypothetical protein [Victivallaceae bacterium]